MRFFFILVSSQQFRVLKGSVREKEKDVKGVALYFVSSPCRAGGGEVGDAELHSKTPTLLLPRWPSGEERDCIELYVVSFLIRSYQK